MIAIALILAAILTLVLQEWYYNRHSMDDLEYSATLNTEEVFEDEDVYLYEVLTNRKVLPLPNLRAESELPEGLFFRLHGGKAEKGKDRFSRSVESVFVLQGEEQIRRRWRVVCTKRGVYHVGSVLLIAGDILGVSPTSRRITEKKEKKSSLTVLPRAINLENAFISSPYLSGERLAPHAVLTDPLQICGTREYTPMDPMNTVNWKSTAVHQRLMVNVEQHTRRQRYTLLLNMQSRPIELHPDVPSDEKTIEIGISVCATLLDRLSLGETPVRMLINTKSELLTEQGMENVVVSEDGKTALLTREYRGKRDCIQALRVLAALPMQISAPAENLWDYLASNAASLADGGNIVIVSSYLDERMLVLHDLMDRMGIHVVFYITGTMQNTQFVPDHVEVYYKTYDEGGIVA